MLIILLPESEDTRLIPQKLALLYKSYLPLSMSQKLPRLKLASSTNSINTFPRPVIIPFSSPALFTVLLKSSEATLFFSA